MSWDCKRKVDWDRYRIRCLTNEEEFQMLDKHIRELAVPQELWDDAPMTDLHRSSGVYESEEFQESQAQSGCFEVSTTPNTNLVTVAIFKLNHVFCRNTNDPRTKNRPYGFMD